MKKYQCVFVAMIWVLAAVLPLSAAAEPGYYSVIVDVLPIMNEAGAQYEVHEREVVDNGNVEGVVVYGNRLELRESGIRGWFGLVSPEDGSILGYVDGVGVEKIPDYKDTGIRYYIALKDAPELMLSPGRKGAKYKLSAYGYSLLKGEVVPSRGELNGMLYLEFETLSESGNEGWGGRYAWGNKKDFIALDAYQPDNSKLNPAAIPRKIRTGARLPGGIEDLESEGVKDVPREILSRISKHGFAIDPTPIIRESVDVDDMADSYRETGNYEVDFITADIFVHSFHLLFDHTLQKLERVHLAPALEKSLTRALAELERLRAGEGSGLPEGSYETARDMFSTALALLAEKPDSIGLSPIAAGEVRRVKAAEDTEESEITGKPIDYTMFKPRGHYTLTPEFERFFRAVGYLGSAELSLFDDTGRPIAANVTAAALISLVLDALGHDWEAFEEPIGYLVGVPNSGNPKVFRALARKHIGSREGEEIGKNLSDAAKITALADDIAAAIKGPAIQSTGYENRFPVFRISGRRFTWDAYVMNRLTSPRVGTDASPRNIPEGTDVMAALGSSVADKYAGKNDAIKNYRENLEMLKLETRDYLSGENTVYAKWLSVFKAGFEDSGSKQFFYNKPAWQWKKLSTYLASWAELKHDTILYGEASAAEMGEGGDLYAGRFAAPKPRGYVEPDPQVFDALLAAVRELRGLIGKYDMERQREDEDGNEVEEEYAESVGEEEEYDFYSSFYTYGDKLDAFAKILEIAGGIAKKEAEGAEITPKDYETIKRMARWFTGDMLLPGSGQFFGGESAEQLKMALVADAATNGFDHTALTAATGTPREIYVFVNDKSGGARLARGYVYSYYEFERPLAQGRMNDDEWKELVYDEDRAAELKKYRPAWYGELEK